MGIGNKKLRSMETKELMTDEEMQKDASRLAEILYQFCALIGYSFKEAITIVTFACIDFVMIFTKQCGGDPDAELDRFAAYVNTIAQNYKKTKEEQKGGN